MCIIEEMKKASGVTEYQGYGYRLSSIIEILIMGLILLSNKNNYQFKSASTISCQ